MQEGKVEPTIHKNPISSKQLQQLYETGQLGESDINSSALSVWFYITFYFGERGRENQTCCFFRVHLKGDVAMSFAAPLHVIKVVCQITPTNSTVKSFRFLISTGKMQIPQSCSFHGRSVFHRKNQLYAMN